MSANILLSSRNVIAHSPPPPKTLPQSTETMFVVKISWLVLMLASPENYFSPGSPNSVFASIIISLDEMTQGIMWQNSLYYTKKA